MTSMFFVSFRGKAVEDALIEPHIRGVLYYRKMVGEIAAETGETAEELIDRIAPRNDTKNMEVINKIKNDKHNRPFPAHEGYP